MSIPSPKKGSDPGHLRWLCRRGMQELDVLLGGFLERRFSESPPDVQRTFVRLLDQPDDLLWDWLSGRQEPDDPEFRDVVRRIRQTPVA